MAVRLRPGRVVAVDQLVPATYPGLSGAAYVVMGAAAAVTFFASMLLHELGHTFVALAHGVRIRGISLWLFGGVARFDPLRVARRGGAHGRGGPAGVGGAGARVRRRGRRAGGRRSADGGDGCRGFATVPAMSSAVATSAAFCRDGNLRRGDPGAVICRRWGTGLRAASRGRVDRTRNRQPRVRGVRHPPGGANVVA